MAPAPGDVYFSAASSVLAAMARQTARFGLEIDGVLDGERGRWVMFSMERLRKFGYRLDSY